MTNQTARRAVLVSQVIITRARAAGPRRKRVGAHVRHVSSAASGTYQKLIEWRNKIMEGEKDSSFAEEWRPMPTAPRNATEIEVSTELGRTTVAHWAEGDGENVPPFRGWFEAIRKSDGKVSHYLEIETPEAWRPIHK